MMEWLMIVGMCVFMARVADAENRSGLLWGLLTFVLCLLCLGIPLAFLRVIIAGAVSFGVMFAHKLITEK